MKMAVLGSSVWIWVLVGVVMVHQNTLFSWPLNDEGIALLRFKERVVNDPFGALSTWNVSDGETDPCSWFGLQCAYGNVVSLNLGNCCLDGTLAPELGHLIHIRSIILSNNSFSGEIPEGITAIKQLEMLDLSGNNISGDVPAELGKNTSILLLNNGHCCHISTDLEDNKMPPEAKKEEDNSADTGKELPYRGKTEASSAAKIGEASHVRQTITSEDSVDQWKLGVSYTLLPIFKLGNKSRPKSSPPKPPAEPSSVPSGSSSPPPVTSKNVTSENPRSSTSHLVVILPVAIGGFTSLALVLGLFLWIRRRNTIVGPQATGFSGQLEKALIIGSDRSHTTQELANVNTYMSLVKGVRKFERLDLEVACEDFSNVISSSSTGTIYKGTLSNGVEIAVVSFPVTSAEVWTNNLETQFIMKVNCLSKVNHKNFVNLLGYCKEEKPFTRMLVFQYAPNGTLFEHLHVKEAEHLDWKMRLRVTMGMAYCLGYMHQMKPPIVHGNIHSSAVHLSEDYAPKISDSVLAKEETFEGVPLFNPSISTTLDATTEDDVYGFGVTLLETITGQFPCLVNGFLKDWVSDYLMERLPGREMIDPTIRHFDAHQLEGICEVIKYCLHPDPGYRPRMGEVAARLRDITSIDPDAAAPKPYSLWWANHILYGGQ